jgi:hypothetical protein
MDSKDSEIEFATGFCRAGLSNTVWIVVSYHYLMSANKHETRRSVDASVLRVCQLSSNNISFERTVGTGPIRAAQ